MAPHLNPGRAVNAFSPYVNELRDLYSESRSNVNLASIKRATDGEAGQKLGMLVPLEIQRENGAFFTPPRLAKALMTGISDTITSASVILDPACGAGNLLLAAGQYIGQRDWAKRFVGFDIQDKFVEACRLRLALYSIYLMDIPNVRPSSFVRIRHVDGLTARLKKDVSHVLMNPPFVSTELDEPVTWASGKVNLAAVFLDRYIRMASAGTHVAAILPEVLRRGSRYAGWREEIESAATIRKIAPLGQFARSVDVDVFAIWLTVGGSKNRRLTALPTRRGKTVGDFFDISVGHVVNNRDPQAGRLGAFVTPRDLPPWETVARINKRRRFKGKAIFPPVVLIRRTSRPGQPNRCGATLILGKRSVFVDNHLLIAQPKDGSIEVCRTLMNLLQTADTELWIDNYIRCRHLTVEAIRSIPWKAKNDSG